MQSIRTLAEAETALQPFWPATTTKHRHTLDFMIQLMDYLGNPQNTVRVVHVAGTSGKTSTAYYTAALLQAAGKKVGLTVSPHVDTVNERVQINLIPLPEVEFCRELTTFLKLLADGKFEPTYFELLHAFAFWEFARQRVDYAVVEVGVGGLLDSTNVISRPDKVCVLTDIGLDHTKVLGDTIPEIAAQKAGIITLHNAVFCYKQTADVMDVFRAVAERRQADFHVLSTIQQHPEAAKLPLFQQRNYGLALEAVAYVLERDAQPFLPKAAKVQAARTYIPARMEVVKLGTKTVIMDAAHNAQKLRALFSSVRHAFPGQPIAVLTGFIPGRRGRIETGAKEITAAAQHVGITAFSGAQDEPVHSVDPQTIADACRAQGYDSFDVYTDPETAFQALCNRPEPVLVVTGSFYLLNHIRPLVHR